MLCRKHYIKPQILKLKFLTISSILFPVTVGLLNAYPQKEIYDGVGKYFEDSGYSIKTSLKSKLHNKIDAAFGHLNAWQIEKKLRESTVRLTFKFEDQGQEKQAHCTGVYFKKIPVQYEGAGFESMSGIAFPSGCLLSNMKDHDAKFTSLEIGSSNHPDTLITIEPQKDFDKKTNIYMHHAINKDKYNKDVNAYQNYLIKKGGAIAFLRISSEEYHKKFDHKNVVTPWNMGFTYPFKEALDQNVNSLFFAITSSQDASKNPFTIKYAKITEQPQPYNINKYGDNRIISISGSSPDGEIVNDDLNYNDGGPIVQCTEDGSSCRLLGFVLSKTHFPELYKNDSSFVGSKIALLYGKKLGVNESKVEHAIQKAGDYAMGAGALLTISGSFAAGIPIFIGGTLCESIPWVKNKILRMHHQKNWDKKLLDYRKDYQKESANQGRKKIKYD